MELKLNIGLEDLLKLIQQLPSEQLELLKQKLDEIERIPQNTDSNQELKDLISRAPIMSEEEYNRFLESRKEWNNWRGV